MTNIALKDFIKATLHAVVEAVDECQTEIVNGAIIAPPMRHNPKEGSMVGVPGRGYSAVTNVDFDVCVTASQGADTKGGVGAGITALFVGVSQSDSRNNEQVSRIRFSIPVALSLPGSTLEIVSPSGL